MTTEAPQRSLVQRMEALEKANDIRTKRANLKKQIKFARSKEESKVCTMGVLLETPDVMESMKVYDLLMSTRSFGKVKTNQYLKACEISPSKTVGGLTQRQRSVLVRALRHGL